LKNKPEEAKKPKPLEKGLPAEAEIYYAPPPPANGRMVGLDCHPDIHSAAVMRGQTPHNARKECSRENLSLEELLEWVAAEFTREDLFLMEAGSNSFEVCRRLMALGLRVAVLESHHVGKHAKDYADSDKMAAVRIVKVYLAGDAPCVWVPDTETCERRELLHAHQKAVTDHTAASNSLKGYLNQFTIRLGKRSLLQESTRKWIYAQRDWSALQKELLSNYFTEFDHQNERRKQLLSLIRQQVCGNALMLRCMQLLGIGLINAFALLAVIGDVRRFDRPEKLVAYLGLNPGQKTSGKHKKVKLGTGRRGRGDARKLLVQGAQAVMRMGGKTALGKWGWKLFARKGIRNTAVIAVARKLAVAVWHQLSGNPPTLMEVEKRLTNKLKRVAADLGKKLREQLGLPVRIAECVIELQRRITLQPAASTISKLG
jgi:transposase